MNAFKLSIPTLLLAALFAGQAVAASSEFTVSISNNGQLLATTTGGLLTFSYHNNKQECNDKYDACFIFEVQDPQLAMSGQQVSVQASACDTSDAGTVVCPAAQVKNVTITSAGVGGTVSSEKGGAGQHAGACSSIPITVKRKAGIMSNITVQDGCMQTVLCTTGFSGDVELDGHDKVIGCTYYMRNGKPVGRPS